MGDIVGSTSKLYKKLIGIGSLTNIGETYYFHETWGNRLFRFSFDNGLEFIGLSNCEDSQKRLPYYAKGYVQDNRVFFVPYYADGILIYDINNDRIDYKKTDYKHIVEAVGYGNHLWFWRNNAEHLIRYSIIEEKYYELPLPEGLILNADRNSIARDKNYLYIPTQNKGTIVKFDMESEEFGIHCVDIDMECFTIAYEEDRLWLSGDKKVLYGYNLADNSIEEVLLEGFVSIHTPWNWKQLFGSSVICDGYLYLCPNKAKDYIRVNTKTMEIEKLLLIDDNEIGSFVGLMNNKVLYCSDAWKSGIVTREGFFEAGFGAETYSFSEECAPFVLEEFNGTSLQRMIEEIACSKQ